VGKFQHKVNKDSPAKEAILLVGDDAALSPNAKEMDELLDEAAKKLDGLEKLEAIDKKFKEEKDRLTGNEKIDFLIKYAQKKGGNNFNNIG
jgi:hypothetical protein